MPDELPDTTYTADVDVLVTDWFRRARESQRLHYECGTRCSHLSYKLGIPAIVFSTIVGTSVFASLNSEDLPAWGKLIVGGISIAAAVLTSLQTFLGYPEKADRHRIAGAEYGAIRRSLELLKTIPPKSDDELNAALDQIKERMDLLAKDAPEVPSKMKDKIDKALKSRWHRRVFNLAPSDPQGNGTATAANRGNNGDG